MEDYEEFTESQLRILERFVTTTKGNVFVLRNLPEVIKGALFSRYSRSTLGLRSLLLKEFILNEETAFESIVGRSGLSEDEGEEQLVAIKRAQNFYDRILDGYGDDSIGELGGAHLAIEQVSMMAAKAIEDARLGGSPLEKSTRYIYFDQKINGAYMFYREPILMTSAFRDLYVDTCNMLFETYSRLIPQLTEIIEQRSPPEEGGSKAAYKAALRGKVLDCLRGLLPASALTNLGVYGNGRFFEMLIHRLRFDNLVELQEIGGKAYEELSKVIPSFIRRSDLSHRHHLALVEYWEQRAEALQSLVDVHIKQIPDRTQQGPIVDLVGSTEEAPVKVAAATLYSVSSRPLPELEKYCSGLSEEELQRILDIGVEGRQNRRHKSGRALENASFTFDITADFGAYRDLQRHRILTQERQLLTCGYGFNTPSEIIDTDLHEDYCQAMQQAKEAFDTMAADLPVEAQYVVPMAYNVRWYFHVNLRALQWLCELRSQPAGHANYRFIAQEMARKVSERFPQFERYFKFVDYDGHELGRLGQEERTDQKRQEADGSQE